MTGVWGLGGVLIWASADRFPAMREFYVETLGLVPRSDRPGFVNFEWNDVRLTVAVHAQIEGASSDPLRIMVNLLTDDIAGLYDRLASTGVPTVREPEQESWGWVATLQDPDGNMVQLLQPGMFTAL